MSVSLLQDSLFSMSMLKEEHFKNQLQLLKLAEKAYSHLLSPGLGWIMTNAGKCATRCRNRLLHFEVEDIGSFSFFTESRSKVY